MNILIAYDGSTFGDAAVEEVGRRPWPPDTHVRLIMVLPPKDPGLLPREDQTVFDRFLEHERANSATRLAAAAHKLRRECAGITVSTSLLEGWPTPTILRVAQDWRADLIVLGSHGRGTLSRLFLGSVSLGVATQAPCTVEIVRPRPPRPASG